MIQAHDNSTCQPCLRGKSFEDQIYVYVLQTMTRQYPEALIIDAQTKYALSIISMHGCVEVFGVFHRRVADP